MFPGGWAGVALLLLRSGVGLTAAFQGGAYLATGGGVLPWLIGFSALAIGLLLVMGFLTPAVTVLSGFGAAASAYSWLPLPASNLFDTRLPVILIGVMAVAIVMLGPGAFSLDARLFGFREIIIPRIDRSSD